MKVSEPPTDTEADGKGSDKSGSSSGNHSNGNHSNGNGNGGYHADHSLNGGTNGGTNGAYKNGDSSTHGNGNGNGHGSGHISGSTNGNGNGHVSVSGSSNGHSYPNGSSNGKSSINGSSNTDGTTNGGYTQSNTSSTKSSTTTGSAGDEQKDPEGVTNTPRRTGSVKWFNAHTGWGWITRDDPPDSDMVELFVHIDDIEANCEEYEGEPMIGLRDGEMVEFDIAPGRKAGQLKAVKVTGPGGAKVIGQAINGCRLRGAKRPFDNT